MNKENAGRKGLVVIKVHTNRLASEGEEKRHVGYCMQTSKYKLIFS